MPRMVDIVQNVSLVEKLPGLSVETQFRILLDMGLIGLGAGINPNATQSLEANFRVVCLAPTQRRKSICEPMSVTQKGWDLAKAATVGHILNPVTKGHSVGIKVFRDPELPLV